MIKKLHQAVVAVVFVLAISMGVVVGGSTVTATTISSDGTSNSAIIVVSPNGGETWTVGQSYTITWQSSSIDNVKDGSTVVRVHHGTSPATELIYSKLSGNPGSVTVTVPPISVSSSGSVVNNDYYVTVTRCLTDGACTLYPGTGSIGDISDAPFTIVETSTGSPQADLRVTDIKATSFDGIIRVIVCNEGSAAASDVQLLTERVDSGYLGNTHYLIGNGSLAAGSCKEYGTGGWVYFKVSSGGTYTFRATADPKNIVVESSESNNSLDKSVTIPVVNGPDLSIGSFQFTPLQPIAGQPAKPYISVSNIGNQTAKAVSVLVKYGNGQSVRQVSTPVDIEAGKVGIINLDSVTYTAAGVYSASVTVDPDNVVTEAVENNNSFSPNVTVVPGLTLSVLPNPQLMFTGTEKYSTSDGKQWVRYKLSVSNWTAYPDEMFAASSDLPPCGLNKNASRTWVNIFDGTNGSYIYGYCAFTKAEDMTSLWFAREPGVNPPVSVFVEMVDRKTQQAYKSNLVYFVSQSSTPDVKVISPNGGETWMVGRNYEVKWSSSNLAPQNGYIVVQLYRPGLEIAPVTVTLPGNPGVYRLTVPSTAVPDTTYRVRVASCQSISGSVVCDDARNKYNVSDTSDAPFTVVAAGVSTGGSHVTVLSPNGREKYKQGELIKIRWQGGKEVVQIGIVGKNAGSVSGTTGFSTDGILGWIKMDGEPNDALLWDGKKICSLDGTVCQNTIGEFKILAVSQSTNGNLIFGNDGINGDIANYDLSDGSFTILTAEPSHIPPPTKVYDETAHQLQGGDIDSILTELKLLRNQVQEQQTEIKYLKSLTQNLSVISAQTQEAITNFITYGVDDNTKKLGSGERAAVMYSYKAAFDKLPATDSELADAVKIANGRWPSEKSSESEAKAKTTFGTIYGRTPDMTNPNDNAAVTVMAYGLRQQAKNRNLNSEKNGIDIFAKIFGHAPSTTEEWNIMQAITYSGAKK
ncbi:MAG: CARDB domain-containing protein [Patescibacteria group bacterium]|jgi:hypothetical protein